MPIFRLTEEIIFPDPELADEDGIIAVGGDLSAERLLTAYRAGIFPWFSEGQPIIWWSPQPRSVMFPEDIKISKFMKKLIKKNEYTVTFDKCFETVIEKCKNLRKDNTWITEKMSKAYINLHKQGFAHSVETWFENEIVGGLYGVSLGKCFFGESMFSTRSNASKFALIQLASRLKKKEFLFIDCQVHNSHLESMGAVEIERRLFLGLLKEGLEYQTLKFDWGKYLIQDE